LFVSISQVIGCEDRLRNDLYCVGWGVKLYSNQNQISGLSTHVRADCLRKGDEHLIPPTLLKGYGTFTLCVYNNSGLFAKIGGTYLSLGLC